MEVFNHNFTRQQILRRIGHLSQIAGIKSYTFNSGQAKNVNALDVKTGSGLYFTVIPDRALDIAWLEYKGIPLAYFSKTGIRNPHFFIPRDHEWLRSFFGGMLTTCGLTQVGIPGEDGRWHLNLHGRISNTPAENYSISEEWENDNLILTIRGQIRESVITGENLLLSRQITTQGGKNTIVIEDTVENSGFNITPLMILYHLNIGFPLLSEHSTLYAPVASTTPRDDYSELHISDFEKFKKPDRDVKGQIFFHKLSSEHNGDTAVAVVNPKIGLGLRISFNLNDLPYFTQWKLLQEQDYVLGLEPGNNIPMGRNYASEKGTLEYLHPGETRHYRINLTILETQKEIDEAISYINSMNK